MKTRTVALVLAILTVISLLNLTGCSSSDVPKPGYYRSSKGTALYYSAENGEFSYFEGEDTMFSYRDGSVIKKYGDHGNLSYTRGLTWISIDGEKFNYLGKELPIADGFESLKGKDLLNESGEVAFTVSPQGTNILYDGGTVLTYRSGCWYRVRREVITKTFPPMYYATADVKVTENTVQIDGNTYSVAENS